MENQVLVVLGTNGELVLCWVEDVEQQVTLAGAVERRAHVKRVQETAMKRRVSTELRAEAHRRVVFETQTCS